MGATFGLLEDSLPCSNVDLAKRDADDGLMETAACCGGVEREFLIDNLLVRIYFIIVMMKWTGELNSLFQIALHLPS